MIFRQVITPFALSMQVGYEGLQLIDFDVCWTLTECLPSVDILVTERWSFVVLGEQFCDGCRWPDDTFCEPDTGGVRGCKPSHRLPVFFPPAHDLGGKNVNEFFNTINANGFVPNVLANVVAGIVLLLLPILSTFLYKRRGRHSTSSETWRGKVWTNKENARITLVGLRETPERIDIFGKTEGQIKVLVTNDSGRELTGTLICVDHGKPVGTAKIEFLPRNQIRVTGEGPENYSINLVFGIRSRLQRWWAYFRKQLD